jgi:hypothetical protein
MKKNVILLLLFISTIKVNSQCDHRLRFSHKYNIDMPLGFVLEKYINKNTIFLDLSVNGMLRKKIRDEYSYSTIDSDGYLNLIKLYPELLINTGFGLNISSSDKLNIRLNLGIGYGRINQVTYRFITPTDKEIHDRGFVSNYLNCNTSLMFDFKDMFILGIGYDRGLYYYNDGFPNLIFGIPFNCCKSLK